MSKFNYVAKVPNALQRMHERASQQGIRVQPDQPVEQPVAAPQNNPAVSLHQQQPTEQVRGEALPVAPLEVQPQQQLENDLAEQQRQQVPELRERWATPPTPHPIFYDNGSTASSKPDGGIIRRANALAASVESGSSFPGISLKNDSAARDVVEAGGTGAEVANATNTEGSLHAAFARVGAVDFTTDPNKPAISPDFIKFGSLVTEQVVMNLARGETAYGGPVEADAVDEALGETTSYDVPAEFKGEPKRIAKQAGNAQIGQLAVQEFQRAQGIEEPKKIPNVEAETLGDALKMMWVHQNPQLARVVKGPNNQKYIQLTSVGEDVLSTGASDRKRLFPSKNVRPAKTPLKKGSLPGDTGATQVRDVLGGASSAGGPQKISREHREATRNLATIPNVVNKQRMKLLFSTALPVLQNIQNPDKVNTWEADANDIGEKKFKKYLAAHPEGTQAQDIMVAVATNLARSVRAIAQERNGANYLSYSIQGFQGRIEPQQSNFNPTSSKAVRFVTTNAVPAPAKPGSRVEKNLRQMYASALVKGADSKLPDEREVKLAGKEAQLERWGDRLKEAIVMTDAEAEAIAQAIEQGMAMNDPNFPKVEGLNLDPEADAELIDAIIDKKEDGLHFIDGLIDFSDYAKAKKAGKTYYSYFNGYMDGKTNGIASNGIQMGVTETAKRTGVIRESTTDYLDEEGDVRKVLKDSLLFALDNNGFDGNTFELASEMTAVGKALFSHKDLNKKTTMTFGYGKEIDSFHKDIYKTAMEMKENPALISEDPDGSTRTREEFEASIDTVLDKYSDPKEFGMTFMGIYGSELEGVMSKEALLTRDIMRGAALVHAATNSIFTIKGPTGMDLNFGRDVLTGEKTENKYRLRGTDFGKEGVRHTAVHQEKAPTAAAPKSYLNEETGDVNVEHGDYAYGGSVVGPVQALDAATVIKTASGNSWKKLNGASNGNPYIHTIHDAFKVDAMSYDVALEEVNTNWLNTAMEWSYLEETQKAVNTTMDNFNEEMSKRDPNASVKPNERLFMDYILSMSKSARGKDYLKTFLKKVGTAASFQKRGVDPWHEVNKITKVMKAVGYNVYDPPKVVTNRQLRAFVHHLEKTLVTRQRLSNSIEHTNNNKKQLKKEILAKGYKTKSGKMIALQYYAH